LYGGEYCEGENGRKLKDWHEDLGATVRCETKEGIEGGDGAVISITEEEILFQNYVKGVPHGQGLKF
jgi:hypothetical protein